MFNFNWLNLKMLLVVFVIVLDTITANQCPQECLNRKDDTICDASYGCYKQDCDWDGSDCDEQACALGCLKSEINDGFCNDYCYTLECAWDIWDCNLYEEMDQDDVKPRSIFSKEMILRTCTEEDSMKLQIKDNQYRISGNLPWPGENCDAEYL